MDEFNIPTLSSVARSMDDEASSNMTKALRLSMARASANSCLCPAEKLDPPELTFISNLLMAPVYVRE